MTSAFIRPEATATITVAEPVVVTPGYDVTVYSQDWEVGSDGWSAGTGTNVYNVIGASGSSHSGAGKLSTQRAATTGLATVTKTLAGFVVGQPTTVTVYVNNVSNQVSIGATVGATGVGSSSATSPTSANGWVKLTYDFTPTATTHTLTLNATQSPAPIYWDTIRVVRHVPAVTQTTVELPISQGKVRLDENYSPYVSANFTVPLTSLALLEQIDPRNPQRVTVTQTEAESGVSRTYDLGLRSRSVDHKSGTIDIELASDEILLHDLKRVATTVDNTPRTYEASLRSLCNWALGKIGASLAAGTADANLTAQWDAVNILKNPDAATTVANWTTGSGATTIAHNTSAGQGGPAGFIRATQSGTTGAVFLASTAYDISAREGQMFTASAYAKHSTSGASASITLRFLDSNNATLRNVVSAVKAMPTAWGTRWSVTGTAPANTARVVPYMSISGTASGRYWDLDKAMLTEGPVLLPYFDGDTTDTSGYTYDWEDAANASASTRTATPERLPELFDWKPGQSLFDFLQPLINASGLRLFCDESRTWRLVDPAEYEVPGFVVAQTGHNATEGTDSITRNDDTWADAVVVSYEWTGSNGNTQTRYDVAGDPNGKAILRELKREYPGSGAAASLLASFEGRGRTQSVTVVGEYTATPGMDASVNLPGTATQIGKVRAVEFDLGSGLTRIETRGLTDALAGSWILWNPTQTWSAVSGTLKWKDA